MPLPATLPDTMEMVKSFGTALGLGLLVGLQREWVQNRVAGIRTFALLSLFGALSGLLGIAYGGWVVAAALVAFASLVVAGNLAEWKSREPDSGLTTEMAMLVMFAVGLITVLGQRLAAVMVAGTVMVLLQSKKPLHHMVRHIGEDDLREIARLVLAGLVILPVLPNRGMGYLGVLNPFAIWLMVVLIIGISLAAYLAGKFMGGSKGSAVSGILGGLISSTATTASLARRSRAVGSSGLSLAAVALIASAIVFVRVVVEVSLTAPSHLREMLPPLLTMMVWFGLVAAVAHHRSQKAGAVATDEAPPSELKSAVLFGLLYAVVLVVVAAAHEHFGKSGLYVAAALSGLTDVDAITLSTSRLVTTGHLESGIGWRMILLGGLANVVFKMGLVAVLGTRHFIRPALLGFGTALMGGAAMLFFWP
jgi:uncharacterized membrane protein (DUF4010 family)